MRQEPILSPRNLVFMMIGAFVVPFLGLSVYAIWFGSAQDQMLPVTVTLDRRPLSTKDGAGAILTDVVIVRNQENFDLPNLTVDLNGQYFLYRASPLRALEQIIIPQQVFATKSNQRFVPGRYPISEVNVTAQLPSGARGIAEILFKQ